MVTTRSKERKLKKSDNVGSASWSNLSHDLLLLIIMQVGVFDFIAFSGVCRAWRSVALCNWNTFMGSKQPMRLSISARLNKKECYLEDHTRRKLETTIPHSSGRMCVGLTCGYLIFFGRKTRDFWLVNPLTRKELHFPGFPFVISHISTHVRGILVFSPSMSAWVFVVLTHRFSNGISFSIAGKQGKWSYISSISPIRDLHLFKGKIYTINTDNDLFELKLNPLPTLTLQRMENIPWSNFRYLGFISSGESLYAIDIFRDEFEAFELDLTEMQWVKTESALGEYAFFVSDFKCEAAIKPDTWAHPCTQYKMINYFGGGGRSTKSGRCIFSNMWYFPHNCLNDNGGDMGTGAVLNTLDE
ncbi:hypothetical protein SSX86_028186 [Deinandra increscens subsp. villosa]|uniref:F-box domain-containing protein n=1 Tax=Deinandra increscens subsp. villosa TaxID=3103831 RepID=A0AAP0C787_9ASTR